MIPCTALGCLKLVQNATGREDYPRGKRVVVLGRSRIVGSPTAALFTWWVYGNPLSREGTLYALSLKNKRCSGR